MNTKKKKFFIAGGGTGGHIYPGIAIARALEKMNSELEIEFLGSRLGLETKIVPREGFPLRLLPAGKLNYKGSVIGKILGLFKVLWAFLKSFEILIRTKPVGVLGVGGYASGPFVMAAAILKIPSFIWEPNAHPGLANRWLSKKVPRAFIVFEEARNFLSSAEIFRVGLPVRSELEESVGLNPSPEFHVLIFGGSQGAKAINDVLEQSLQTEAQWLHKSKLIHQTGAADFMRIKQLYESSVFDVKAFEYLFEMEKYYQWADVVICRSGASTIAELAAIGKAAILVPLPSAADDHQRKNAQVLVDKNAALLIEQKDLTVERLNQLLLELQQNRNQLVELAEKVKALHQPKAADAIAQIINENCY